MNGQVRLYSISLIIVVSLSLFAGSAHGGEAYFYEGTGGRSASFPLIGGQYTLYLYAKRPVKGYITPESKECIFGGNFQRTWPTPNVMSLGSGVTISSIVPHKIGPAAVTLPAGVYSVYIATLTTCDWHFIIESTSQNAAGLAPVQMLRRNKLGGLEASQTAALREPVRFYAQFRTDHGTDLAVSGELQIFHDGQLLGSFPLKQGRDSVSGASFFYQDTQWDESYSKYLGKNIARFVVKIGGIDLRSEGEFELTQ